MGVAVMTRMSGEEDWAARALRWATPNLCCSSMTMRPGLARRLPWRRAWVPMMM